MTVITIGAGADVPEVLDGALSDFCTDCFGSEKRWDRLTTGEPFFSIEMQNREVSVSAPKSAAWARMEDCYGYF